MPTQIWPTLKQPTIAFLLLNLYWCKHLLIPYLPVLDLFPAFPPPCPLCWHNSACSWMAQGVSRWKTTFPPPPLPYFSEGLVVWSRPPCVLHDHHFACGSAIEYECRKAGGLLLLEKLKSLAWTSFGCLDFTPSALKQPGLLGTHSLPSAAQQQWLPWLHDEAEQRTDSAKKIMAVEKSCKKLWCLLWMQ